jgi:hypothetical protein
MFDADLVRYICGRLSAEQDPQQFKELLSTLQSVVRSDTDDTRLRMEFLVRQYSNVLDGVVSTEAA